MPGFTNRGKRNQFGLLRGEALPTNLYIALCTSAIAPTADINTLSELTQIAIGNGYADGGVSITPNATDFDVLTEDDVNDRALMQVKDIVFTASGGPLPASGNDARHVVMTGDDATVADREVWFFWDMGADYSVSDGQPLTLQDLEIRIND